MVWELPQMEPGGDVIFMHIFTSSGMPWRKYYSWPWATTIHPLVSSPKPSNPSWLFSQPFNLKICPYLYLLTKGVVQKARQAAPSRPPYPPTRRCKKCTSSSPICSPGKSAEESASYLFPSENKWNQRTNARGVHVPRTQPSPHASEIKRVVSGWSVCSLEVRIF